jgi:hypothetical protein
MARTQGDADVRYWPAEPRGVDCEFCTELAQVLVIAAGARDDIRGAGTHS